MRTQAGELEQSSAFSVLLFSDMGQSSHLEAEA